MILENCLIVKHYKTGQKWAKQGKQKGSLIATIFPVDEIGTKNTLTQTGDNFLKTKETMRKAE